MNRPFKNLPQMIKPKTTHSQPTKNWSVVKVKSGKIIKHLFVGLTKEEAEGAAKAGNWHLRKREKDTFYKILQDAPWN